MIGFDATWLGFGLFLLACGAVPAAAALSAERRAADAPGWGCGAPAMFQEAERGATPAELARVRAALAVLRRDAPALLGDPAFVPADAGQAARAGRQPAASSITPESSV